MKLIVICFLVWNLGTVIAQREIFGNLNCKDKNKNFYMCEGNVVTPNIESSSDEVFLREIKGDYNNNSSRLCYRLIIFHSFVQSMPVNIRDFFGSLHHFAVIKSKLKFIKRKSFAGMELVKILDLRKNLMESIPDDAFLDLINLRKLEISHNLLSSIPDAFFSMSFLSRFACNENLITNLDSQIFRKNMKLEEIHLWSNKIETISFNFRMFKKLTIFDLRDNTCLSNIFYIPSADTSILPVIQTEVNTKCPSRLIQQMTSYGQIQFKVL